MLKLVCLDVDGTLVGSLGAPSDRLWSSAELARARGQRLTMCTARLAAGQTRDWAQRLDPDGWHIFHTGAARWNPASNEVRTVALPADALEYCVEIGQQNGWVVETYSWDDYAVESTEQLAVDHAGLLGLAFEPRPLSELEDEIVRVQFVVHESDSDAAMAAAPHGTTASGATSPLMPGAVFVSITHDSVSKAAGVRAVAEDLGVDMAEVMMVGDGHNDLPAVQAVGWGVAMGNAEPELKAAAQLMVADVDDDGAAQAIDASASLGGEVPK